MMKEIIVDPRLLEKLSDREVYRNYLENLYPFEEKSMIELCINKLPIREREITRMRLIYNMGIDEIAFEKRIKRQEAQKIFEQGLHLLRESLFLVESFEEVEAA